MKELNIGKMIAAKRRQKGMTQEELASYMGISKASVSKWETGLSYPDITFLPQLAAFFNISVDELLGYQPQMTGGNIKKLYRRLAEDFVEKPFGEVYGECREISKKYFSCFPLLVQIGVLYLNHHMFAESKEQKYEVLEETIRLMRHVKEESTEVEFKKQAQVIEASCLLFQNHPQEVLEILGEEVSPKYGEVQLIAQAYEMLGDTKEARRVYQVENYQHMLIVVMESIKMAMLTVKNLKKAEECLARAQSIGEIYHLERLHPNTMMQVYLAGAQIYAFHKDEQKMREYLEQYVQLAGNFLPLTLHGDEYYDDIEGWIKEFALGNEAPRDDMAIKKSLQESIENNPAFESFRQAQFYKELIQKLKSALEHCH